MTPLSQVADRLWGQKAKFRYLFLGAICLLFLALGAREIWTQEHRWADIVFGMFYRNDFLHPYLGEARYYDKPLLSYWLIALVAKIVGNLNVWSLRVPSALAGLLAVWSIFKLGSRVKDRQLGLLAGWMLLTTYYFLFWARTSSADMLNLAGCLFAVAWYMDKREKAGIVDYAVFFIILALTSLCKGLVGAIIPMIAVFADMLLQKSWKQHLRPVLLLSTLPALIIYALPFLASSYFGGEAYGQNGLYLVYKENILRYFQPFDHKGPIYTYFLYLPIYMLPWTLFFIPALLAVKGRWKWMSKNSKWLVLTVGLMFLFFTLSGSRRSYYVLPIVPFAMLMTADWLLFEIRRAKTGAANWAVRIVVLSFFLLLLAVDLLPAWYYKQLGVQHFSSILQQEAGKIKPWKDWDVVMLDAETKLSFYLKLPPTSKYLGSSGERLPANAAKITEKWPVTAMKNSNTIFISRKLYATALQGKLPGYRMVELESVSKIPFVNDYVSNKPVAFIPEYH